MRLIDADALDTRERGNNSQRTMWWHIKNLIDKASTIDAVPVVRCKDCKHFGGHGTCHYHAADENGTPIFVRDDDFCSYGKRKDGDG